MSLLIISSVLFVPAQDTVILSEGIISGRFSSRDSNVGQLLKPRDLHLSEYLKTLNHKDNSPRDLMSEGTVHPIG